MNKNKSIEYRSDFLFPESSFLTGAGSLLNIGGNYLLFNYSQSDEEADSKAIESDWGVIKQDFETILQIIKEDEKSNLISNG